MRVPGLPREGALVGREDEERRVRLAEPAVGEGNAAALQERDALCHRRRRRMAKQVRGQARRLLAGASRWLRGPRGPDEGEARGLQATERHGTLEKFGGITRGSSRVTKNGKGE